MSRWFIGLNPAVERHRRSDTVEYCNAAAPRPAGSSERTWNGLFERNFTINDSPRIAASVLVCPRSEWPFFAEWAEHLAAQGVFRIYAGVDRTQPNARIMDRKPNPAFSHSRLSDPEVEKRWHQALSRAQCSLEVDVSDLTRGVSDERESEASGRRRKSPTARPAD